LFPRVHRRPALCARGTALVKTISGSNLIGFTIGPLAGIAAAMIVWAILFWTSVGVALVGGFILGGFPVWVMKVVWPRTRGAPPFLYLVIAIIITTMLGSLMMAPMEIWGPEPSKPSTAVRSIITEPFTTAVGWLVGLWLGGIAGVLETYQKARPELFPKLKPEGPRPLP
jgi:hypothetical protein